MSDIAVCIHAYDKMDGGKNENEVRNHRIKCAEKVVRKVKSIGANPLVVFTGAEEDENGMTNREAMLEVAEKNHPELLEMAENVQLVSLNDSRNTEGEVKGMIEFFSGREEDFVISVSSGDHASRIQRLWVRHHSNDMDFIAATVGSEEFYAKSELEPFILEGAAYSDFIPPLNQLWGIPENKREEAADEIEKIIQKYSD